MDSRSRDAEKLRAGDFLARVILLAISVALVGCEAEPGAETPGSGSLDYAEVPPVASQDEIAGWSEVPSRPRTWEKDVVPIVVEYCGPCHVGPSPEACIGGTCLSNYYEAFVSWYTCCMEPYQVFQDPPSSCPESPEAMPVWQCGMIRIYNFVEQGKDPLPVEQVRILEEWIEDGTPER